MQHVVVLSCMKKINSLSFLSFLIYLTIFRLLFCAYPEVVECSVGETLSGDIFRKGLNHAWFLHA